MTLSQEPSGLARDLRRQHDNNLPHPPTLLTLDEAQAHLRISKWMLHRLLNLRKLDSIKIGRRRLIPADAVQALVDRLRNSVEAF